jgi:maltose/maltodextrin transport system substrate-binding protein
VGLIYNKALVQTPPADFADIASITVPEGVKPIMWDYNNTYFTMPLLMANGGYAFVKKDGSYDGKDTGVANEGAIAGATVLKGLIDSGIMPAGVDYGIMDGAMAKGEVAMVLNGPWAWSGLKAAGIDIGVAPIPMVNGKVSPPFLGVYSAAVNAASPNADLAVEFIENYMLTDEGLAAWNANGVLGALADISSGAAQNDPLVAATLANAATGIPMPSNPEMGAFWSAMQPALTSITTGAADPKTALEDAAKRILGGE